MKHRLRRLYITLVGILLSLLSASAHPMDSVEVSLLTCSPGSESWSQYGHTAVRWHDKRAGGMDVAINYGVFSPDAPHFVLHFILGQTDYQLGVVPFELFCVQYQYEKRSVCEQVLNLDNADKQSIFNALRVNMRPENVVYRYNFFYDNCTTRARDLILRHLHGQVTYPSARRTNDSFRAMIHEWNRVTPWTQFGEDILLGVNADRPTVKSQQQFLPEHLREDFARATYKGKPLVRITREVVLAKRRTQENFCSYPSFICDRIIVAFHGRLDDRMEDEEDFLGLGFTANAFFGLCGFTLDCDVVLTASLRESESPAFHIQPSPPSFRRSHDAAHACS